MTTHAEIHAVTDDDTQPVPPQHSGGWRARRSADRAEAQAHDRAARAQAADEKQERRDKRRAARDKRRAKYPARAAAIIVTLSALGIAVYGGTFAYDSLYKLAQRHSKYVPLLHLAPIGFEATLGAVVIWDIYLTWREQPVWFLRWIARLYVAFSIVGNALAGWPDPVGIFYHLPAPIGFAVIVEAVRLVLLKRMKKAKATARGKVDRDPIPLARWLNDPMTYFFYRRWVVSNPSNPDYFVQCDLEVKRLEALFTLRKHFERRSENWKKAAPANYLWQLKRGVNIAEVHAKVLAEFPIVVARAGAPGSAAGGGTGGKRGAGTGPRTARGTVRGTGAGTARGTGAPDRPVARPGTGDETGAPDRPVTDSGTAPLDWRQYIWRRAEACGETDGQTFEDYTAQYRTDAVKLVETFVADHRGKFPDKQEFAKLLGVQKVQVAGLHEELRAAFGLVKPS